MGDGNGNSPADAELRNGVRWVTDGKGGSPDKNVFEWLWEAIQGDFNDERSTGQIAFDAGIAMIPVVDQICDVRDIIANCRNISQSKAGEDNTWKWVALCLTLIGLFPSLGSLVKGVLKIFFLFIRRYGADQIGKAVLDAMTWVITFLRKREVQKYLPTQKIDEVFGWLAKEIKTLRGKINTGSLLAAFDKVIDILKDLLGKVTWLPGKAGARARETIAMVEGIRKKADAELAKALKPVQESLDHIIRNLELKRIEYRSGIVNLKNIHYRGALPEAQAIALMRKADPPPQWLTKPRKIPHPGLNLDRNRVLRDYIRDKQLKQGYPSPGAVDRFADIAAAEIKGPARLYRVISPSSLSTNDCWMSEEVFNRLKAQKDPKSAWRRFLAVWPHWNVNGQFVTYEVKAGETLKVWRGKASTQLDSKLPDGSLDGGWEQIVFTPAATRDGPYALADTTAYYKANYATGTLTDPISRTEFSKLSEAEKASYEQIRTKINHPNISGPFKTDWDYTDFDAALPPSKLGLPVLPGQLTQLAK